MVGVTLQQRDDESIIGHLRTIWHSLLWSMRFPGQSFTLRTSALGPLRAPHNLIAIGRALLDAQTGFYTPHPQLAQVLHQAGAPLLSSAVAPYHFYPWLTQMDLDEVAAAQTGSADHPDLAATLIIACDLTGGTPIVLSDARQLPVGTLTVAGVPARFWSLRAQHCHGCTGWDIYLISDDQIVGLPRSLHVDLGD